MDPRLRAGHAGQQDGQPAARRAAGGRTAVDARTDGQRDRPRGRAADCAGQHNRGPATWVGVSQGGCLRSTMDACASSRSEWHCLTRALARGSSVVLFRMRSPDADLSASSLPAPIQLRTVFSETPHTSAGPTWGQVRAHPPSAGMDPHHPRGLAATIGTQTECRPEGTAPVAVLSWCVSWSSSRRLPDPDYVTERGSGDGLAHADHHALLIQDLGRHQQGIPENTSHPAARDGRSRPVVN